MTKTQGDYMKHIPGIKFDSEKLRYDLIPHEVLEGLAEVLTYGAKKYADNNWKNVDPKRYEAAMFRHYIAFKKGEQNDSESSLHHLKHMLTNAAFLLYFNVAVEDKYNLSKERIDELLKIEAERKEYVGEFESWLEEESKKIEAHDYNTP